MSDRILLIGEANPFGGDSYYALYPVPTGCAGWRLCHIAFGMYAADYLKIFDRVNLCPAHWRDAAAKDEAARLRAESRDGRMVFCGAKVARAFGLPFEPFCRRGPNNNWLILPHPSGKNRLWDKPDAVALTRQALLKMAPELEPVVGRADRLYVDKSATK